MPQGKGTYGTKQGRPPKKSALKAETKCPSGFRWDAKKGKCVQRGVGPKYKP